MELNAEFGIDLSSNNHPNGAGIDYHAVKNSGIVSFAYIKATQGVDYVNPFFGTDYSGLKAVGIKVGAYLFWDFSNFDITKQVEQFASHYGWPQDGSDLIPMLDAEYNPTNRAWSDIQTTIDEAIGQLLGKGYPKVGVYFNRNWQANLPGCGKYSQWLAEGENEQPASIMQFGYKVVPGIPGQVDWNVA